MVVNSYGYKPEIIIDGLKVSSYDIDPVHPVFSDAEDAWLAVRAYLNSYHRVPEKVEISLPIEEYNFDDDADGEIPEGAYIVEITHLELDCDDLDEDDFERCSQYENDYGEVEIHFDGGYLSDFEYAVMDAVSENTGFAVESIDFKARREG